MPNWDQICCVHWFGSPHCEALPLVAPQQDHRDWQAWAGIETHPRPPLNQLCMWKPSNESCSDAEAFPCTLFRCLFRKVKLMYPLHSPIQRNVPKSLLVMRISIFFKKKKMSSPTVI